MERLKNRSIKALRSLEKYTKTDMVYLAKGGFWLGIGQFVATGSAFLISVAFANLLSPETYGLYKFVLSINSLILITTLSGMDSAITQAVSRGFEGTMEVGFKIKMKWGFLGSMISILISIYYLAQGNITLAICFGIISIFAPFTESSDIYNSLLWGKKLFNVQAKYNAINTLIILASTTSVLFLTKNLYIVLATYLIALTVPNFFFIKSIKKTYQENKDVDPDAIKYGKHLSIIGLLSLLVSQLDKILVFHYIGATNLAIYSLAVAPTDQVKGLLKNLNSLAMPKFSEKTTEQIKKSIWHKVWLLALIMIVVITGYIILVPFLFKIFFPKYLASIIYSQIISISLIFAVLAGFLATILESQKAKSELYKYNIYTSLINIITLFPLVYFYGIWGAIISRSISRIFSLGYSSYLIKKN